RRSGGGTDRWTGGERERRLSKPGIIAGFAICPGPCPMSHVQTLVFWGMGQGGRDKPHEASGHPRDIFANRPDHIGVSRRSTLVGDFPRAVNVWRERSLGRRRQSAHVRGSPACALDSAASVGLSG